jgi:hypothetical protein
MMADSVTNRIGKAPQTPTGEDKKSKVSSSFFPASPDPYRIPFPAQRFKRNWTLRPAFFHHIFAVFSA